MFLDQRDNPQYWRYSIGLERQLPWNVLVEVSYLGQKGRKLPFLETANYVPQQFRSQSPTRDVAAETFLSLVVSNPFVGLTPDSPGSNGATIARRRLLYQHPQFEASGICTGGGTFCNCDGAGFCLGPCPN